MFACRKSLLLFLSFFSASSLSACSLPGSEVVVKKTAPQIAAATTATAIKTDDVGDVSASLS